MNFIYTLGNGISASSFTVCNLYTWAQNEIILELVLGWSRTKRGAKTCTGVNIIENLIYFGKYHNFGVWPKRGAFVFIFSGS